MIHDIINYVIYCSKLSKKNRYLQTKGLVCSVIKLLNFGEHRLNSNTVALLVVGFKFKHFCLFL